MARLTPDATVGLPANRALSRTSTSLAKMTASAAAITAGSSFWKPPDPWVSIDDLVAGGLGGLLEGLGGHVGVGDAGRAGRHPDELHHFVVSFGAAGAAAAAATGPRQRRLPAAQPGHRRWPLR